VSGQYRLDDVGDEFLLHGDQIVQGEESHLRLDHPEFHQVAAGLGLLGAEGGAKAVHLAMRGHVRFVVELAGLGQEGRLPEVVNREQAGGVLAGGGGQDGRVNQQIAVIVQPVADGADDRGPDAHDRPLAR